MAQQGDETILEEAKSLLVQGRRCMALEDFQSATDLLERSCQLFDAFYGVAKRECADAYLEYGLALVALANLEAGSGTDKLMKKAGIEDEDEEGEEEEDEEAEDEEDEEAEDEEQEDGDDEKTNGTNQEVKMDDHSSGDKGQEAGASAVAENGTKDTKTTNGDVPMEATSSASPEKAKTNGVSKEPQASSSSAECPVPGTSAEANDKQGEKDDGGEDVDNEEATTIEIAWEVLCLAKRLYMTDESLEGRSKLAETLQKIGEISIEWDNNDNAVSILEECLKIRTAILQPDDRLIALTYYNLGLAHSFKSDTQSANENFQNAINVIEKRIAALSQDLEKAKASQDTLAIGTYQKEINELKELLPDMTMRLDDSKEDSIKSTEVLKRTREEMQQEDEAVQKVCSDKSKPVDDISHLVKRRAA